jgi:chromosome segregation ATPase
MSSDTPRTDEVMERSQLQRPTLSELAEHARALEREVNGFCAELGESDVVSAMVRLQAMNRRLEAALAKIVRVRVQRDKANDEADEYRREIAESKQLIETLTEEHNAQAVYLDELDALRRELAAAKETIGNQRERIRYLEGATNHAGGTLLSAVTNERDEARAALREIANMKGDESVPLEIRAFELVGRMFFAAKAVLSKAAGEGAK